MYVYIYIYIYIYIHIYYIYTHVHTYMHISQDDVFPANIPLEVVFTSAHATLLCSHSKTVIVSFL